MVKESHKVTVGSVLKSLVLGAAIIVFWRGTWNLADIYLYPSKPVLSAVMSILIGIITLYVFHFDLRALRP